MKHIDPQTLETGPHPTDLHVGGRVRMRRKFLGISQEALAAVIGLTFQQVQKYERGTNRISASKLHEIARALKVPIEYFFVGLEAGSGGDISADETDVHSFLMTTEGIALARVFPKIADVRMRRRLLEMATTLAGLEEEAGS